MFDLFWLIDNSQYLSNYCQFRYFKTKWQRVAPCLTPTSRSQVQDSDLFPWKQTHNLIPWYQIITLSNLPCILEFINFRHIPIRKTLSNAYFKSMKQQNNFFPLENLLKYYQCSMQFVQTRQMAHTEQIAYIYIYIVPKVRPEQWA